jgi:hypothetical protein
VITVLALGRLEAEGSVAEPLKPSNGQSSLDGVATMSEPLRRRMHDLEREPLLGIPEDVGFRGSGGGTQDSQDRLRPQTRTTSSSACRLSSRNTSRWQRLRNQDRYRIHGGGKAAPDDVQT